MTERLIILLAACLATVCAAAETPPDGRIAAPFAIAYSFDQTPSRALLTALREEFVRLAEPVGINVVWLAGGEVTGDFSEIFSVRFRGSCGVDSGRRKEKAPGKNGIALAETSVSDGRVLPFATVHCDVLRRYLSPARGDDAEGVLGKAMARVTAHEIYHMLTRSVAHCASGIAQAEYSPADLSSERLAFGRKEAEWLRARAPEARAATFDDGQPLR